MPVRDYPFTTTRPGDAPRPYLPVAIVNPTTGNRLKVFALIDTGADECALPASFASLLGHNLQNGQEKRVSTGNGITIAYGHTTRIEVEGFATQNVLIDFMPNLNIPLFGVKSFLSNFVLTVFKQFSVNNELGVLCWPDGQDIAPETLYYAATGEPLPAWMSDAEGTLVKR